MKSCMVIQGRELDESDPGMIRGLISALRSTVHHSQLTIHNPPLSQRSTADGSLITGSPLPRQPLRRRR